jgi:putative transposase
MNVDNPPCKSCGSTHVRKYGFYKGVQRYFCNDCGSKFKNDDTTFHMKTDAKQVTSALSMYYEGMSVKAIRRNLLQEYNNAPSTATIYEWIQKYTQYAIDTEIGYKPEVGNVWVADETVLKLDGQNAWFWDIIDEKTRFLLASRLSRSRTTRDAQILMDRAIKMAGKAPKVVITDALASYLDVSYGKGAEHRQGGPFNIENNSNLIERFHGTLKQRTKVMRGLKNFESALEFTKGWLVHYNYLRPHESLQDKTPAEVAGIDYPYKNWADIIRKHKPSKPIIIEHQSRADLRAERALIASPKRSLSKRMPRISPPMPKLSEGMGRLK